MRPLTYEKHSKELVGIENYVIEGDSRNKELDIYHLIFAPTYSCNLRCSHCYLPDHGTQIVSRERAFQLLDDWTEIVLTHRGQYRGIFHIKGGEPFVVSYFSDLLREVGKRRALILMLTTNGTVDSDRPVHALEQCNVQLDGNVVVNVSLDGATEGTHSLLRGAGTHDRTIRFIRRMKETGITVHMNCVIHKHNVPDIPQLVDLALNERVSQVNFLPFVPKGYGNEIWDWCVDPVDVYSRIADVFLKGDSKTRQVLSGCLSDVLFRESIGIQTSNECVGGYQGLFYIVPNGDVFSCPNLVDPSLRIGNLNDASLRELYRITHERVYDSIKGCGGCSNRYVCKGETILRGPDLLAATRRSRLEKFQSFLLTLSSDIPNELTSGVSYCFSRNL